MLFSQIRALGMKLDISRERIKGWVHSSVAYDRGIVACVVTIIVRERGIL